MANTTAAVEHLSLGSCRVYDFTPGTADSARNLSHLVEGEVTLALETEQSAPRPNVANGQMLDGHIYEFAGQGMLTLPLTSGFGPIGQMLYPSLQDYATEDVTAVVPAGVLVPSRWLCLIPEAVGAGEPTHIFVRVVPATKEHLAKFGNAGNRGAKPNAAQFVTTYLPTAIEPLQKGLLATTPTEAVLTALSWTFVPEAPEEEEG